jgi:hypothetical protein
MIKELSALEKVLIQAIARSEAKIKALNVSIKEEMAEMGAECALRNQLGKVLVELRQQEHKQDSVIDQYIADVQNIKDAINDKYREMEALNETLSTNKDHRKLAPNNNMISQKSSELTSLQHELAIVETKVAELKTKASNH